LAHRYKEQLIMPRTSSLAKLSARDIHRELQRRHRSTTTLARKRDRLLAKVASLDEQIAHLGGEGGRRGRMAGTTTRGTGCKRPQNDFTLPEAMAKVIKGKTMGFADIAAAVQKAGYKSSSSNFRTMVSMQLTKFPKLFKRVERGQYTAT
jgi:hypothetical protein